MTAAIGYDPTTKEYQVENVEQVLVFPADLIEGFKNDAPTGILLEPEVVQEYLRKAVYSTKCHYMARPAAEKDPSFKQVIPYVVFQRSDGLIFSYARTKKGGEARLHNLRSIGVGGHINPCDDGINPRQRYWAAMEREISEEIKISTGEKLRSEIVGLIYDDSNLVGQVHFGVVHVCDVSLDAVLESNDPALAAGEWIDPKTVDPERYENWSKLALQCF